ncbi:MAG TPA: alpha-L-fucosidase [Armatimonadota bacterium]|jgi:alpha-L-fucosidase
MIRFQPVPLAARLLTAALAGALFVAGGRAAPAPPAESAAQRDARLAWWRDARFGMFIHWGPVTLKGTEIGWSRSAEVPAAEYDSLYKRFNPVKFNAKKWVSTAKAAGMKYVVLVTKHHDGFAMWPTKLSDYSIANTPFHRDVVGEIARECRRQGIRFCAYYSVLDWRHPDYPLGEAPGGGVKQNPNMDRYVGYMKGQLKELISNYGPLGLLWFDGEWEKPWTLERGKDLEQYLHELQPDLIINDRIGKGRAGLAGDYATPEQTIGRFNRAAPWESCITICQQWAWKPNDAMKPLSECIRTLATCAGGDGNLLLNVGPTPEGEIEPRQVDRLKELGAWLRKYGKSIYGTRGGPFLPSGDGVATCKGNTVYLHIFQWPGETLTLSPLPAKVLRASSLTGGKCAVRQTDAGIELSVDSSRRDAIDTIIALELSSSAEALSPVRWAPSTSLAAGKKASASNVYQGDAQYAASAAVDDDDATRWATDTGSQPAWLEVDLGAPTAINEVSVSEWAPRIQRFELLCRNAETEPWKPALSGSTMGAHFTARFPTVTARYVRLNILETTDGPTINEFAVR